MPIDVLPAVHRHGARAGITELASVSALAPAGARAYIRPRGGSRAIQFALCRIIPRLVWAGAVLAAIAGAVVGVGVTLTTNSPPEEAALIALVYAVVVAPYGAVVRAIDKLLR